MRVTVEQLVSELANLPNELEVELEVEGIRRPLGGVATELKFDTYTQICLLDDYPDEPRKEVRDASA